jgi:hypothetical protein
VPDLLTLPIPLYPPIHIKIKSPKLCCCVLPYVSSHPRPLRATIQVQVTVVLSTRPEIGHDPSLGCSNARHHRAWPVLLAKSQCASRSCHRVANTETASSLHCHLALCRLLTLSRCTVNAGQTMSLFASSTSSSSGACTVHRQRVATMTCRAHRIHSLSHETSHILSAHEQFDCYVQPQLQ